MAASDSASASFSFDLTGNAASEAKSQADALQELRDALAGGTDELRGMQTALRNLKGGGVAAETQMNALKKAIAAQKATISGAQGQYLKLGGTFKKQIKPPEIVPPKPIKPLKPVKNPEFDKSKISELTRELGLGRVSSLAFAGGLIAVAAALATVVAGAAHAVASLVSYGLEVADARRNELLRLEGLTKIRNFWYGFGDGYARVADKASFLQEQIDAVSDSVALGRDKIADYATQLYKMGLRGGNLQHALEGVAITASTQGEGQASIFANWAAGAAYTGQSVKRLSEDVKARLGGIAKAQLLSLSVQTEKLHQNFARLFSGLNIEGFATGVKAVADLFSQSTITGQALKQILETVFQPFSDAAGSSGILFKRVIQGMILAVQELIINFLLLRNWMRKTFGDMSVFKEFNAQVAALGIGKSIVWGIAGAFLGLAFALALVVAPLVLGVYFFYEMLAAGQSILNFFSKTDWAALGSNLVDGIVEGLERSATKVIEAGKRLANLVRNSIRNALDMHSPARKIIGDFMFVGAGAAIGMDRSRPMVNRAARRMAEEVRRPAREGAVAGAGVQIGAGIASRVEAGGVVQASGGRSVTIGNITVQTQATDAKGIAADIWRELESVFSGAAAHMGAAEPQES